MIPRTAVALKVLSEPGKPVRLVLVDGAGVATEAELKPALFERIWDRIGEAMSLADAKGIGAINETWEL